MAWASIIGQQAEVERLQQAIVRGRLPQALLLTGSDGAGTLAVAIAFARVVNCTSPITGQGAIDACGECRSCMQAATLQHPDIRIITSLPSGKADTEEDLPTAVVDELSALLRTVAEDPYETLALANASQIRIAQIRELKRMLSLSSVQAGRRIVIIHHADELNNEAANAFLKTLEEPHSDVTIIMTSQYPERLPATIVSRCQEMFLPPVADEHIIEYLMRMHDSTRAEAELITQFCEGSITRAREFLAEDMQAERTEAIDLLRASLRGRDHRLKLMDVIEGVAEGRDRIRTVRLLTLIALWLRDARAVASSGTTDNIANVDQQEAVMRFAETFGKADLSSALRSIERAVRDVRRNVSIQLVVLSCMLEIRRLLLSSATPSKVKAA